MKNKKMVKIIGIILAVPIILFIMAYLFTNASVEKTVAQDPSIPHVIIDGVTFHSETFGNPGNPVVIVLHGGPGSGDYRSLLSLKELGDEYYVVFYDQRGTGLSPRVDASELTFDQTVLDLNLIVDHYSNGKKVNLIGHSFGGMVISPYIGKYPGKVNKAVFSDPGFLTTQTAGMYMAYVGKKMQEKESQSTFDKIKMWFELLHIKEFDGQEKQDYLMMRSSFAEKPFHSGYYCNGEYATDEPHFWRYSALASSSIQDITKPSEFVTMTDKGPEFNFIKGVDKFTDKVLFLASGCNQIIGENIQKIHIKSFPNAELKVIEGAGHDLYAGKPEAVRKVIKEYFNE